MRPRTRCIASRRMPSKHSRSETSVAEISDSETGEPALSMLVIICLRNMWGSNPVATQTSFANGRGLGAATGTADGELLTLAAAVKAVTLCHREAGTLFG